MKNLFKSSMLVAIVAAALVGCSKDTTETNAPVVKGTTVYFKAEVVDDTDGSRASLTPTDDEKLFTAAWEATDQIGISAESDKGEVDNNLCGIRENDVFSTTFQNCQTIATTWFYRAYYPYTANKYNYTGSQIVIPFGGERIQYGNDYNSAYDIMAATNIDIESVEPVKPGFHENGEQLVFAMHRLTAIAYFHFKTTAAAKSDKVLSVTLSATPSEETEPLAADEVSLLYGDETETTKHSCVMYDKAANSIKITYDSDTAPTAADFKAWFNVLPGIFSGVKVAIETKNYTATITRTGDVLYEAGKLYKVSGKIDTKWTEKTPAEPVGPANGTILWSENWKNATTTQPASNTEGTVVYNNGTISYTYSATNTKLYTTGEAYAGGTLPELLLSKNNNTWTIDNIPTGNCSEAILTFKSNKNSATYWGVSSATSGITIGDPIVEENGTKLYIATYGITLSGVDKFNLTFTNSSSDNTRLDDIELVVGKPLTKLNTPADIEATADDEGNIAVTWSAVENADNYTVTCGSNTQTITTTSHTFAINTAGTHTVSVVANPSDTETYRSSNAGEATATILANPTNITRKTMNAGQLVFTWGSVTNATEYAWAIYEGATEIANGTAIETTTATYNAPAESLLKAKTTYTLKVKTKATGEYGALKEPATATCSYSPAIAVNKTSISLNTPSEANGTITVTLTDLVAEKVTVNKDEFITVATLDGTTLAYTVAHNAGEERTGNITLSAPDADSVKIAVTQATCYINNPEITSASLTTAKLQAKWNKVTNATKYEWRLTTADGTSVENGSGTIINPTSGDVVSLSEDVSALGLTEDNQYVLYVKSVPATDYAVQGEESKYDLTCEAAATETTVTMTTFTATSADMDTVVSYSTAKGGGTSDPKISEGKIRLYQKSSSGSEGGKITITAKSGYTLQSVTIGSSKATKIAYTIGTNTTKSTTEDLAANATKTVDNINAQSITFYCMGTTKNDRLHVNYLSATYK